jgi:hypothetical protein
MSTAEERPKVISAPSPDKTPITVMPTAISKQKVPRAVSLLENFLMLILGNNSLLECLRDDLLGITTIITDDPMPHHMWENKLHVIW